MYVKCVERETYVVGRELSFTVSQYLVVIHVYVKWAYATYFQNITFNI